MDLQVLFIAWSPVLGGTCLRVTGNIVFSGAVGFLRGIVTNATITGLRSTYTDVRTVVARTHAHLDMPETAMSQLAGAMRGDPLMPRAGAAASTLANPAVRIRPRAM